MIKNIPAALPSPLLKTHFCVKQKRQIFEAYKRPTG
jgi:hypothetical protein